MDYVNTAASKKPTVYMLLPMEVITGPQLIPVFQVSDWTIANTISTAGTASNEQPVQNKGDSTRSVQLCKIPIWYIGLQWAKETASTMSKKLEERVRVKKKSGSNKGVNHSVVI